MAKAPLPVIWSPNPGTKYCVVNALQNVDDHQDITKGLPRAKDFPADAYFEMDKASKKQVALPDALVALASMAVVSKKLKEFIEAKKPRKVEFLPVTIKDHKGKDVKDPYFIMNALEIVDCIDKQKSDIMWNRIDKDMIAGMTTMVLMPDKINPELLLFRPKHLERKTFVRRDFADELLAEDFTGLEFMEPDEFTV